MVVMSVVLFEGGKETEDVGGALAPEAVCDWSPDADRRLLIIKKENADG